MSEKINAVPWQQPLFMIYDASTDERVPLTQERLDQLIAVNMQYGQLVCALRDMHNAHCRRFGFTPSPFMGFAPSE